VHVAEDCATVDLATKGRLILSVGVGYQPPDFNADCLEQLLKWKEEIRPDYLIIRLRQPGGPLHQKALEAIRAFGASVIPRL
jgi:hypothetical protein